jgi:hypothetical protein
VKKTATDRFITDEPAHAAPDAAADVPSVTTQMPAPSPAQPPVPQPSPAPAPTPAPVVPTPVVPPAPAGPVTVAPNAVSKLSGDAPNITRYRSQSMPQVTAAKVCIDPSGSVSSVDFVGKLDKRIASDLADQLKTWKYKPYLRAGSAVGACFVVTMRMK